MLKENHKTFMLLLVPLMLAVFDFFFLKAAFPLHSGSAGYDQDPAYAYLFNGLLILDGYPPYHIDHPGTPLQLLFALTIFIRWFITRLLTGSSLDFVDSVIADPESYLFDMAVLLLALNLYALTFFGRRISEATGKIHLGMFCQLSLLCFTIMAPKATYPAPEAVLIFCSLILLGLLSPRIFRSTNTSQSVPSCPSKLVGATFALGLAVKITFAPMVFLIALLPQGKERRIGVITGLIIFLLLVTPALPNIDRFVGWVTGLVSNSGIHGGGGAGFINIASIPANLHSLFVWFPLFLIAIMLTSFVITHFRIKRSGAPIQGASILIVVALLQTGLVLKHPGAHYMVAVLPISLVLLAWLYLFVTPRLRTIKLLPIALMSVLTMHSVLVTGIGIKKLNDQRADMTSAMTAINSELRRNPDALIICSFRCALPQYALTMALIYAPQLISDRTMKNFTNFYDFDIFQSKLISIGRPPKTLKYIDEYVSDGGIVIFVTPKIYPQLQEMNLIPLTSKNVQNAYLYLQGNK
jgi:hypothetical protein